MDILDIFDELSDDEDELMNVINIIENPRQARTFRIRANDINMWTNQEFIKLFRISKASVQRLIGEIGEILQRPTGQNHALSPLTQLLVTLRFYATGSMIRVAADFGGIDSGTASRVIRHVSEVIASLSRVYIKMPSTREELQQAKNEFVEIANFPNTIGAIDCTHVRIQSPGGPNAENFRNRKGFFSINVQTVSDANLRINNIVARWPGATHDSQIFANSRLKAQLDGEVFDNSFLLGDSGYALDHHIMTPLDNPLTPAQNLYNESHIRTRNVVERQYGVWKRRFQVLRLEMRLKITTILTIIVSSAVLHNLAIQMNDIIVDEPLEDMIEEKIDFNNIRVQPQGSGIIIRNNLINNHFANLL